MPSRRGRQRGRAARSSTGPGWRGRGWRRWCPQGWGARTRGRPAPCSAQGGKGGRAGGVNGCVSEGGAKGCRCSGGGAAMVMHLKMVTIKAGVHRRKQIRAPCSK